MEPSKRSRSVQIIVEIFSLSLQLIAIVSPGWVGELHPDSSFYSSLFYGVICDLECKIQSHHTTYSTARRESSSDKAVADVWYFRVVMVQVAAVLALMLSLVLMAFQLFYCRMKVNKYSFTSVRPVLMAVTGVLELTVVANMWIGYDFNTRLSLKNIFPYSLVAYSISLVLVAALTLYFTYQLVSSFRFAMEVVQEQHA